MAQDHRGEAVGFSVPEGLSIDEEWQHFCAQVENLFVRASGHCGGEPARSGGRPKGTSPTRVPATVRKPELRSFRARRLAKCLGRARQAEQLEAKNRAVVRWAGCQVCQVEASYSSWPSLESQLEPFDFRSTNGLGS